MGQPQLGSLDEHISQTQSKSVDGNKRSRGGEHQSQMRRKNSKKRRDKRVMTEIIKEAQILEGDISDDSISDNDIQHRNTLILSEAEKVVEVCEEVGYFFKNRREQMVDYFAALEDYSICPNIKDSVVWKMDPSEIYSPKSFCMSFIDTKMQRCLSWKEVWAGLAPPKVEALCWQIMWGKMAVKCELIKRSILQRDDSMYGNLGYADGVSHGAFPLIQSLFFFLGIMLFEKEAKWPYLDGGMVEFLQNIECIRLPCRVPTRRIETRWICPQMGCLKFNVDGSAKGKPRLAGIGGVLRDHEGNVKIQFMKSIGLADSNLAELLAIKEAFLIFASSA
ncbi:hypothetical protein PTKIN_Ptkin08bG0187700 [Pterospermum kingtungense]